MYIMKQSNTTASGKWNLCDEGNVLFFREFELLITFDDLWTQCYVCNRTETHRTELLRWWFSWNKINRWDTTQTHTNTLWVCFCCLSHSQCSLTRTVVNTWRLFHTGNYTENLLSCEDNQFSYKCVSEACLCSDSIKPGEHRVNTQCLCEHSTWTSCECVFLLTVLHVSLQVQVENKRVHSQLPLILLAQHVGPALPLLLIWYLQLTQYSEHRPSAALFSDPYYESVAVTFMTLCSHFVSIRLEYLHDLIHRINSTKGGKCGGEI